MKNMIKQHYIVKMLEWISYYTKYAITHGVMNWG